MYTRSASVLSIAGSGTAPWLGPREIVASLTQLLSTPRANLSQATSQPSLPASSVTTLYHRSRPNLEIPTNPGILLHSANPPQNEARRQCRPGVVLVSPTLRASTTQSASLILLTYSSIARSSPYSPYLSSASSHHCTRASMRHSWAPLAIPSWSRLAPSRAPSLLPSLSIL